MKLRRFLQSSSSQSAGFTLLELLVAMFLGMMIIGMAISSVLWNRSLYSNDLVRTRLNQNLRSAMDIVGISVREAGENLTSIFPAIEITNGAAGAPDTLILRRNLLAEVLNLCTAITAGTNVATIRFADSALHTAPCDYTSNLSYYNAWRQYRLGEGGVTTAYIYNSVSKLGEFFFYEGEAQSGGTVMELQRPAGGAWHWNYSYPVGTTAIYIIEEWQFQVANNYLQVVEEQDTANPLNIAFGITDFQASVLLSSGTTMSSFTRNDNWTQLRNLSITLGGEDSYKGKSMESSYTSKFFLRNVLSN